MKRIFLLAALLFCGNAARAANAVYIAQSSAGGNTGADCADAKAASYFNTSGNWSATPTGIQIGPATTVHMCGTITTSLTFQGSGSSGNTVNLVAESGANITEAVCPTTGCIATAGFNFILIDGQTNGAIAATANGSSLANQSNGIGIDADTSTNVEIRNWTISNMFVQVKNAATSFQVGVCIQSRNSSTVLIHNNACSNDHASFQVIFDGAASSAIQVYNNTSTGACVGYTIASNGTSPSISTISFHDNQSGPDSSNWDTADNSCHEDHLHIFAEASGTGGTITGFQAYNNYWYGDLGCHQNGYFYEEADIGTITSAQYFNNVINNTSNNASCTGPFAYPPSGYFGVKGPNCGTGTLIANNTVIGNTTQTSQGNLGVFIQGSCAVVSGWNNTLQTMGTAVVVNTGSAFTTWDNNNYSNNGSDWNYHGDKGSFALWKSACSCDASGFTTAPNINLTTFAPNSGSPLIGAGNNLTSQGITALDSDKNGVARPGSAAWDVGAIQFANPTASTPTFSPVAGSYSSTQSVTITASTGGVICYTTNGTTPATNGTTGCTTGTLFTTAISVSTTETVEAIAGGTGFTDGSVGTALYTITTGAANAKIGGGVTIGGGAKIQ